MSLRVIAFIKEQKQKEKKKRKKKACKDGPSNDPNHPAVAWALQGTTPAWKQAVKLLALRKCVLKLNQGSCPFMQM